MKSPIIVRRVVGHSMMPALKPNQLVCGVSWLKPKPGRVVIVRQRKKEIIKRIAEIDSDRVILVGDNAQDSWDSRRIGSLPTDSILAVVVYPFGMLRQST